MIRRTKQPKKPKAKKGFKRRSTPLRSKKPLRAKSTIKRRRPAAKRRGKKNVSRQRELLPPRAVLLDRCDTAASLIVRAITPFCVTCKRTAKLTVSHIFRRRCTDTRHDIEEGGNCVTQCMKCNVEHSSRPQKLMTWFIQKFGLAQFAILQDRFRKDPIIEDHQLASRLEGLRAILSNIPAEATAKARKRSLNPND